MVLAADQVRLTRSSGSLLMGPGTPYTILPEWDPWSRTSRTPQSTDRPYAHGSIVGAEWVDAATVLIPVSVYRNQATKAEWMAAHQALAAAFTAVGSSGELCELQFEWGGSEYAMFGRPAPARVTTDNVAVGKSVEQCVFTAPDPRIYSAAESSLSIGLPIQTGGLTVPVTAPVTVTGRLVGGRGQVTNAGTAAAPLTARIDGPVVEPGFVLYSPDGSIQSVRFSLTLLAGQWLEIDSVKHTAFLNGLETANRRPDATWLLDDYPIQPGTTRVRFVSGAYDEDAGLTVTARSAWW